MDIKELWQAAVKERWDKAFELFCVYRATGEKFYIPASNNIEVEQEGLYLLKPIAELIKLDIERYGENAFLMYQWRHDYDDLERKDTCWKTPESNKDCEDLANSTNYVIERKLYANCQFNLNWAKMGVMIECLHRENWIKGEFDSVNGQKAWINFMFNGDRKLGLFLRENGLRHPFPPTNDLLL